MLSTFSCVYWPSVCLLWINVCFGLLPPSAPPFFFLIESSVFLILSYMSCLYILEINSWAVTWFAVIFAHFEGLCFHLVYSFLCCVKTFKLY